MKFHFNGPPISRKKSWQMMAMASGHCRRKTLPVIRGLAELIKFCRRSPHKIVRDLGIVMDTKASKEEILSIDFKPLEDCESKVVAFIQTELGKCSDSLSLAEARHLLKSGNDFKFHLAIHHSELSAEDLIEALQVQAHSGELILACDLARELSRFDVSSHILRDLAKSCDKYDWFGRLPIECAIAIHRNTPTDVLQKIIMKSDDMANVKKARENLRRRGALVEMLTLEKPEVTEDRRERAKLIERATDVVLEGMDELARAYEEEDLEVKEKIQAIRFLVSDNPRKIMSGVVDLAESFRR